MKIVRISLVLMILLLTACSIKNDPAEDIDLYKNIATKVTTDDNYIRPSFEKGMVQIEKENGQTLDIKVEIAKTSAEKKHGLMFVEELPFDKGMFFIFDKEKRLSFWMKNTLIPLDIIYIDEDNRIVDIKQDISPCKKISCPTYPSKKEAKYVLEVNGGFAETNNIELGDKILFNF